MGSRSQEVKNVSDPWKPAQPFLKDALGDVRDMYASGGLSPAIYEGDFAPRQTWQTRKSYDMVSDLAREGDSPSMSAAGLLSDTMGGARGMRRPTQRLVDDMVAGRGFADLDAVKANALGSAIPAASAQFTGAGMGNSSAAMDAVGRAAVQAIAPIEYGAFENQQARALQAAGMDTSAYQAAKARELQAAGMAPAIERAQYIAPTMLANVGAQRDARRQDILNAEIDNFYRAGGADAEGLSRYVSMIGGLGGMGGMSTQQQPGPSTGARIGGGLATGLGTYGTLAGMGLGGPIGIGAGALAGLAGLL